MVYHNLKAIDTGIDSAAQAMSTAIGLSGMGAGSAGVSTALV